MTSRSVLLSTALSAALSLTLTAQTTAPNPPSAPAATQPIPGAYHVFACIKIKPGKDAEAVDWIHGVEHKVAQAGVDAGKIYGVVVLRAVLPQGHDAKCDYGIVTFFRGLPNPPLTPDEMTAVLQKAGVSMTAKEFMDRRESLASLVFTQMLLTHAMVGKGTKGGYVVLNSMSATNVDDWVAFETKVWQPYAEALVKDGMSSGWALNLPVFPDGSKDYIVASTVDMYPTWESVFKRDAGMADRWKKVHPDMDPQATMEQANKLRTIEHRSLYRVEDEIMAAQ